ncbi:acyltransferase family protein [Sphaerisporangium corydalis]|uniref:Acyltransferase n=1 Tax=Sphaerisporangium corydalis TaxID=1441875 RepID=A0ABV9EAF1_9ACTN|nr:acyltransferase [Sphaerisporangium corydalis]
MSGRIGRAWAGLAERTEAATPPTRDRGADALRALAILGVIAGHWLVTAWTFDHSGNIQVTSPLASMPSFIPLSWVLQTLAIFFFVGGYAAGGGLARATARGSTAREWLGGRARRLVAPAGPLLLAWAVALAVLAAAGVAPGSLRALATPALGPLWFLAVFGLLTALTPLLVRVRHVPLLLTLLGVVLAVDAARFAFGGPAWLGWANLAAGWLVPYVLGLARARGALAGGRVAAALLAGGAAGAVVLVTAFGYPASMIGVTGSRVSNLSPPTLAAVCFGVAQVGLALLLHRPLGVLMRRPRLWAGVVVANLSAMTVFLWHQTALTVVMLVTVPFGGAPGLASPPESPPWLLLRLSWLPLPAGLLVLACLAARRARAGRTEHGGRPA